MHLLVMTAPSVSVNKVSRKALRDELRAKCEHVNELEAVARTVRRERGNEVVNSVVELVFYQCRQFRRLSGAATRRLFFSFSESSGLKYKRLSDEQYQLILNTQTSLYRFSYPEVVTEDIKGCV